MTCSLFHTVRASRRALVLEGLGFCCGLLSLSLQPFPQERAAGAQWASRRARACLASSWAIYSERLLSLAFGFVMVIGYGLYLAKELTGICLFLF